MTTDLKHTDALIKIVRDILLQLQHLVSIGQERRPDFLVLVKTFLLNVVSAAMSLADIENPGIAPLLYAEMEVAMKTNGLREVADFLATQGAALYSAATIDENDKTYAMNYIGQQLAITLFKSLCELPKSIRNQDMVLRAIGQLLVNLLNQHFTKNAHQILDRLCAHVHLALNDLTERTMH